MKRELIDNWFMVSVRPLNCGLTREVAKQERRNVFSHVMECAMCGD